jgi:prophage regulatory protein
MLRMPAVLAETGHRSHATIYNAIHAGLFTKPVQIGQRAVAWPADEVAIIIAARIAGKSESELRKAKDSTQRKSGKQAGHTPSHVMVLARSTKMKS